MADETEKLIDLVHNCPYLYDTSQTEYKNIVKKTEKWNEIAGILNMSIFMEGLGNLKDYIKARNPLTLDKAIQAAREEERIRMSSEEVKKLHKGNSMTTKKVNGACNICGKPGHWARDCRSNKSNNTNQSKNSSTPHEPPKPQ
ncbi:hypothetical protein QTP88_015967 [Uroleucon formosanum]